MWARASKPARTRWRGFAPIRAESDPCISRNGRRSLGKATPSCLVRAWRIGKPFSRLRKALVERSITSSSKKAADSQNWKPRRNASTRSIPRIPLDSSRNASSLLAGSERVDRRISSRGFGEIVLFAQFAIDAPCDYGSHGALDAARITAQQNGQCDFRMGFVGVGHEPAYVRRRGVIVAGTRLAKRGLVAAVVEAGFARAVENSGEHAFANFGENRSDIQIAFHARREILHVFWRARVLQIVERASVCECRRERGELQRSDLNSFTETGHARNAAERRRRTRECTGMLFRQVVAGQLAKTQQARVFRNRIKPHAASQLFKKHIVGVGHRIG